MSNPYPDELVDAVDLYVAVQQVLIKRLTTDPDPTRVVVAMQAQLEQLQAALRGHHAIPGADVP